MSTLYNSNYQETMPFSDTCKQFNLATNTAQSWTIPGTSEQYYQALFGYALNSNIFVCLNSAATTPGGGANTAQPYSEFKPDKRYVRGGDTLSFVTGDSAGAYVGVSLRQIQGS
jgi:hypothetical protein